MSYVNEDTTQVDRLCEALDAAQIPYWRDRKSLAPGDQWKQKIREAIRSGALVFLACFSEKSRTKPKSFVNEELALAIDEFRMRPPSTTWLIPVRFDDGDIPAWDLGAGRVLGDLNYVDLYGEKYPTEAIKLTTTISRIMGIMGPDAATVRASVEGVDSSQRTAMIRRMTKEMIPDPARRIELDDLIAEETRRILSAMRDEEQFPISHLDGTGEDQMVRSAELTDSYRQLAEPLCSSLQIATRWTEGQGLTPWISALRAITSEAKKPKGGITVLLGLRHIPALAATFTAALAATGQGRWDNLKTLLVDLTYPLDYESGYEAQVRAENLWTPFRDGGTLLPNLVARAANTGDDPRTTLEKLTSKQVGNYYTPVAEWLHAVLRQIFTEQYPDDDLFDNAFDRTEIMLGIVSQDLVNVAPSSQGTGKSSPGWFGRATWRADGRSHILDGIASEVESKGMSWEPLVAGLFGGLQDRATVAIRDYTETFNEVARKHS